jgi:uncharacterized protein (DUF1800 family)
VTSVLQHPASPNSARPVPRHSPLSWPPLQGLKTALAICATGVLLAACGGGSSGPGAADSSGQAVTASAASKTASTGLSSTTPSGTTKSGSAKSGSAKEGGAPAASSDRPASLPEGARFLAQATFGPSPDTTELVFKIGYNAWMDNQFVLPATSHRAYWEASNAAAVLIDPNANVGQEPVFESFWKQALTGNDQLRQRLAFALSEIFVVSMVDSNVGNQPRAVADWLDMLGQRGFGTYRELLEAVTLHPMMGTYLNMRGNQKADAGSGRVPDENYAREVMQLFSIGLVKLNLDGTPVLVGGKPVETYTPADISGIARVFTGFSFACANTSNNCFYNGNTGGATPITDPDRWFKPMQAYPQFHSAEVKSFLGVTIAPQTPANPLASLKVALDTLADHPNTAPFISKQLIQRLVTSNPTPAYVQAVATVFNNNGAGVRGDLKAVVRTILTHPEARTPTGTAGKVREPVLRASAYMRAFAHTSDTGRWRVGNTDNPGTLLGQTVLRSGSVFNFFRPGYVPPGTQTAAAGLVAPEMQLLNETSASGWVNYMRDNLSLGVGIQNFTATLNRRDLQRDWSYEMALAPRSAELVTFITDRLLYGTTSTALRNEIFTTVNKIVIPPLNATGSNQAAVDAAKRARINTAVLLTVASPEFVVLK